MSGGPSEILFYVLAGLACVLSLATVLTRQVLRSAIFLMAVLSTSAGFYLLQGAEFLAGAQVLIYVGGIVVLLVFAVMLTRSSETDDDRPTPSRLGLGLLASGCFFGVSAWLLSQSPLNTNHEVGAADGGTRALGRALLDSSSKGYLLPFEVISILLLAVLIAGIVVARKESE
jgi:NADH-quinone oxidoreductase subunit J